MNLDFIIIGGGMAGASAAYRLASHGRVLMLEREATPGYHSTGRSAAALSVNLGTRVVRALTAAGRPFLEDPPDGFSEIPLTHPRPWLYIARADQRALYEAALAEARETCPDIVAVSAAEAVQRLPILRPKYVAFAFVEPDACDLDVDAIHQGFLRGFRARGGEIETNAEVMAITRTNSEWRVRTRAGDHTAPVVLNAAGAWADEVARLAGVRAIGLVPKRRTAITFDAPEGTDLSAWPELDDIGEEFYLKPEVGRLLGSPADETPVPPQDVQPEALDVAIAVDRIERATTLQIRRVTHQWAGLRSFVADRGPVVGMDGEAQGFFWLAGQGGAGIQTAPGISALAEALLVGGEVPATLAGFGVKSADLSPERLERPAHTTDRETRG